MLLRLEKLVQGAVVKRPSASVKTPYVADVFLHENKDTILAHSLSLGCCGLADTNAQVLLEQVITNNKTEKPKCSHRIHLSIYQEPQQPQQPQQKQEQIIIGINPKLAETLVEKALEQNVIQCLQHVKSYKREVSVRIQGKVDSRFDFTGVDQHGIPFIMEIKNVPLADYEDVTAKERKHMDFTGRDISSKVAYFPDGYRKKSTDPISPRALKHVQELTWVKSQDPRIRCILCFVIQRPDVNRFTPSVIDPIYREAIRVAMNTGVEIIPLVIKWEFNNASASYEAHFVRDDLPIVF
jgi:DNA-binding sugar fermentation-stimulating protein